MSTTTQRLGSALIVMAVIIAALAGVLFLTGSVDRPGSMFAGAGAVLILGIAARIRGGSS